MIYPCSQFYCQFPELMYAVNGPDLYGKKIPVKGFILGVDSGELIETFGPNEGPDQKVMTWILRCVNVVYIIIIIQWHVQNRGKLHK